MIGAGRPSPVKNHIMRRVQLHSVLSRIASQQSTSLNDAADRVILPFSSHCSGKPVVPMLKLRPLLLYCVSAWLFAFCLDAASGQTSDNSKNSDFDHLAKSAALARESGKNTEAIERYQRALELRSDWEEGWWYLGTLLYDTDRFAEAVPALRKVV